MSTPFNVREWASQAGIQTTGGFAVIAECVTLDELERFAQIVISHYVASQRKAWQGLTDDEFNQAIEEIETALLALEVIPSNLYTAPPQREWQGLTDEEANELTYASVAEIEAKLKEKNT